MAGSDNFESMSVMFRAAEGLGLLILAGVFLAAGSILKRTRLGDRLKTAVYPALLTGPDNLFSG